MANLDHGDAGDDAERGGSVGLAVMARPARRGTRRLPGRGRLCRPLQGCKRRWRHPEGRWLRGRLLLDAGPDVYADYVGTVRLGSAAILAAAVKQLTSTLVSRSPNARTAPCRRHPDLCSRSRDARVPVPPPPV